MNSTVKIEHDIVLLGAGNANLQVVKWWGMQPLPSARLTLINDTPVVTYSGMIPGCIAGQYNPDELSVDLQRLCAVGDVRLVLAAATHVDTAARQVHLQDRMPLDYTLLSLNIGSQPLIPANDMLPDRQLSLKPLNSLLDRIEPHMARAEQGGEPFPIVVVGGGASAFEICLTLRRRLAGLANVSMQLVTRGERLLAGCAPAVSRSCAAALQALGVEACTDTEVVGGDAADLHLADGGRLPYALCVWATPAAPLPLIERSGFETDEKGFIRVHDSLDTVSDAAVFAVGDCASLASRPDLAKAGIFSVRAGPVLWENLQARIVDEPLQKYRPQSLFLFLLNCGDGTAVMSYGRLAGRGKWMFKWKDFIDRGWMRKFHEAYETPMAAADMDEMRCGGCGAKVGRTILERVLQRLEIPSHPDVFMGCGDGDDAAVLRLPDGKVQVQTTDFFRAFIDDPYLFGYIAATNATSDLYAMNATPFAAQAMVTVPFAGSAICESDLYQVLAGALRAFRESEVVLTGGHTSEATDFQVGFCMTGYAVEAELFRKDALSPGDRLVLTKPLGTGALMRAASQGVCRGDWYEGAVRGMMASNREAAVIFASHAVRACTDVTGFGLAGHLLEMLTASDAAARLNDELPLYDGYRAVVAKGIRSTLHEANAQASAHVCGDPGDWLFDPQTSGGLLAGVAPAAVDAVLGELHAAGLTAACVVGKVVESDGNPTITIGD